MPHIVYSGQILGDFEMWRLDLGRSFFLIGFSKGQGLTSARLICNVFLSRPESVCEREKERERDRESKMSGGAAEPNPKALIPTSLYVLYKGKSYSFSSILHLDNTHWSRWYF